MPRAACAERRRSHSFDGASKPCRDAPPLTDLRPGTASPMNLLDVKDLNIRFDDKEVVKDISFSVAHLSLIHI